VSKQVSLNNNRVMGALVLHRSSRLPQTQTPKKGSQSRMLLQQMLILSGEGIHLPCVHICYGRKALLSEWRWLRFT